MPTPLRRPRGRRRSALVSVATLTPALVLLTTLGAVPQAAQAVPAPDPVLELVVPEKLTVESSGKRVYSDLGVALENTGGPLEVWLTRGDPFGTDRYEQGIEATTHNSSGGVTADIPVGPETTLQGLRDLVSFSFEPVGRTTTTPAGFSSRTTCLGGEGSQRISPAGPATSPYPDYCEGYGPFALASVQGLPGGWGTSLLGEYAGLRIPAGRYDVTVTMDEDVADALGVPADQREQEMRLKVRPSGGGDGGGFGRGGRLGGGSDDGALRAGAEPTADEGGAPDSDYLPDLRSLPAFGMDISGDGNYLRFSATVWNAGNSPLVVDGFRSGPDSMEGYQYYFDEAGNQIGYNRVGDFEWDPKPTHLHWHFQAFAQYSLVPYGAEVDPGDGGHHHVKSRKEAFCLANTDAVDLTGDGAAWKVGNTDLSTDCGTYESRSIRQVLAAGWGDTYAQFRAGQSFNLKGLENGCYDIVVEGNPLRTVEGTTERTLVESNYDNNDAVRTVKITGKPGARKVTVTGVGIVEPGPSPEDLGCVPHEHDHEHD